MLAGVGLVGLLTARPLNAPLELAAIAFAIAIPPGVLFMVQSGQDVGYVPGLVRVLTWLPGVLVPGGGLLVAWEVSMVAGVALVISSSVALAAYFVPRWWVQRGATIIEGEAHPRSLVAEVEPLLPDGS